ncbi:hypothetical protein SAMN05216269_12233 [Flavobacterium xinjiangense]|uniref:Uncharacterized protein n=1 Tax=Flavobacterium xinjiangense TaxID=178356 RepID=A0A1M7PTH9_9FLAO|nr:hypothetical protein SAMN05216269_12233 [Flavobacterium xinjiangense]
MMHRILLIEKEIIYVFTVFLIFFNLVSLFFIVDLLGYDEIIGYLTNGELKSCNPRALAFLLFGTTVSNLLFVIITLMARFFSTSCIKRSEPK